MEYIAIVLVEGDSFTTEGSGLDLQFQGCFGTVFSAVEFVWGRVGGTFTGWKVGEDRSHGRDVIFKANVAQLELRSHHTIQAIPGLGPNSLARAWVRQDGYEGDLPWIIGTFASVSVLEEPTALGDLQRSSGRSPIYVHKQSAMGQHMEERLGAKLLQNNVLNICTDCHDSPFPGVHFPVAQAGSTAYVTNCGTCQLFPNDAQAAQSLSAIFQLRLASDQRGYFLVGVTVREARVLVQRFKEAQATWTTKS